MSGAARRTENPALAGVAARAGGWLRDRGGRGNAHPANRGVRGAAWLDSLAAQGCRSADDGELPAGRPSCSCIVRCCWPGSSEFPSRHGSWSGRRGGEGAPRQLFGSSCSASRACSRRPRWRSARRPGEAGCIAFRSCLPRFPTWMRVRIGSSCWAGPVPWEGPSGPGSRWGRSWPGSSSGPFPTRRFELDILAFLGDSLEQQHKKLRKPVGSASRWGQTEL